jgi:outer membrane protein, heavy metal efflux system
VICMTRLIGKEEKFRTVKIAAALLLAVLGATRCAAFHPKPLSPVRTASIFEDRSLENPGLKQFLVSKVNRKITPWPQMSWDFPLLTLVSLYYHPDLDVMRAQWEVAKARMITAGERPNPTLGFIPRYNTTTGTPSPWILNFALDIPFQTAGKRDYRIVQARHLSDAARLNIAGTAWRVRSRLRASLLDLYAAVQAENLLKRKKEIQEQIVKGLEKRLEFGEASEPEVTQTRIFLDQTDLSLRQLQNQRVEARVRLADALGLPVKALKGVEITFDFLNHPCRGTDLLLQKVRYQALNNRSDLLALLSKYEASQSALKLEIARQYPDIHLGPGFEFDQGDNKWSLGISLSLPIFNSHKGPIAEAEARRKEVAAQFVALQAKVIGETDRALAGYGALLKKLEAAEALLKDKEKQLRSMQAMFTSGESDQLALLGTRLELASGRLSRLEALVMTQQALGALEDALQRPLGPGESFPVIPEAIPRIKKRR